MCLMFVVILILWFKTLLPFRFRFRKGLSPGGFRYKKRKASVSPEAFALKSWVICDKYRALCQSPRHQRRLRVAVVTKFIIVQKYLTKSPLARGNAKKSDFFQENAFSFGRSPLRGSGYTRFAHEALLPRKPNKKGPQVFALRVTIPNANHRGALLNYSLFC